MRRALPCGAGAVLIECDDSADALGLWRRLAAALPDGVDEAVPGARTVLVIGPGSRRLEPMLLTLAGTLAPSLGEAAVVVVPVRYDGMDLGAVARGTGLTEDEVVRRHSERHYIAAFGGFVPGFAYLTGLDPALHLPRRATPRTRVPGGSVAIADTYTAVYPRDSPGGWHVIGTTPLRMFDAGRRPAALLEPGTAVRFERID